MKFSRSFWVVAIGGGVISFTGVIGIVYYLCFPEKWGSTQFWHWLPTISMLAVYFGFAVVAAWSIFGLVSTLISHSRNRDISLTKTGSTSMKTSQLMFVCLLVFALSSALGFIIGVRIGFHQAYARDMSDYKESADENEQFQARVYFQCLKNIDSGDITNLQEMALRNLRFYVQSVQEDRQMGYTWAWPWLYSNAVVYVSEHPRQAREISRVPTPPNPPPTP
jgi:hypothetical protein